MGPIVQALADNPLLLLFAVCAIGYPLGRIRIGGASLGTASVLFVGIAIGAFDPRLKLPDFVYLFGLVVFIYTIGLSSAQGFFKALNRHGLRDTLVAFSGLALSAALAYIVGSILGLRPSQGSALSSGAFTNASGLASVVEALKARGASGTDLAEPVVAYSLAYPVGILGPMLVMSLAKRGFGIDLQREAEGIPSYRRSVQRLESRTIRVTRPEVVGSTVEIVARHEDFDVVFGRVVRDEHTLLATSELRFALGDLVVVVGPPDEIDRVTHCLGEEHHEAVQDDRSEFDYRRVFVSNPKVAGRRLAELALPRRHGATITRIKRGEQEFIPQGDSTLELGDRVRVLTHRDNMGNIARFLGDSYKALSEIDFLTFCLGISLGLVLGLIPIPLPGGLSFRLGFAGGPLIVALIFGKLGRTGSIVWNLPYSANLTLRQFGLLLFAAGIGTRAGYDFYHTLARHQGLPVFLLGAALTLISGLVTMLLGHLVLRIPLNTLFGIYAGAQTQPINLAYAVEQTKNELPTQGYATVFPAAIILKIVLAQVLFGVLPEP